MVFNEEAAVSGVEGLTGICWIAAAILFHILGTDLVRYHRKQSRCEQVRSGTRNWGEVPYSC